MVQLAGKQETRGQPGGTPGRTKQVRESHGMALRDRPSRPFS